MAGKITPFDRPNRRGWASKNVHNVEAKDARDAVFAGNRLFGREGWYAISAVEVTSHIAQPILDRAAKLGRTFFAVHFHRIGYHHADCKGVLPSLSTSQRAQVSHAR
jgi:hypothetical protein